MSFYRKKPVVVEAITFDALVQHGRDTGANIVEGMPWAFSYKGWPISHETNVCYLIPTLEGTHNMTPEDMLITGVKGEIYPCKLDIFEATYEKADPKMMRTSIDKPYIESRIKDVDYIVMKDGRTTICTITMGNGYTVNGFSACVDIKNFDQALGRKYSYDDAFNKLWPLEGYLLAERLTLSKLKATNEVKIFQD